MAAGSHPARAAIHLSQLQQLRALLAAMLPGNRFYWQKLSAAGVGLEVASLADFSERFPFTTKAELVADQLQQPPYGTNLTYPLNHYTRFHQTSGTTGIPLRWLDTPPSWDWMVANWLEVYRAAGVTRDDRVFFAFTFGPFIGFWLAYEASTRLGALAIPGGGLSSEARLRAILDNAATVLCCTPTYAIRLGEVAAAEKMDLARSRVKKIMVAGEPGGSIPHIRKRMEELWPGARVFDHHGMTEVGPVTYECPERPQTLHVMEGAYYAEIIDPATGHAAAAGQSGELVLTTLGRLGSPLLRYRTGDLVQADPHPCRCGRGEMALPGGILGRTDDMIVVRGVNVFPSAIDALIRANSEILEYQVRIATPQSLVELSVQIEPQAGCGDVPSLVARLEKSFQTQFALRIPVTAVAAGALPRFEMKSRRWIKI